VYFHSDAHADDLQRQVDVGPEQPLKGFFVDQVVVRDARKEALEGLHEGLGITVLQAVLQGDQDGAGFAGHLGAPEFQHVVEKGFFHFLVGVGQGVAAALRIVVLDGQITGLEEQ
jgi:hypothetical protein